MSADSPRRGLHKGAQVISPQPISDKSIIDSVAGIINDIVPQAYTNTPSSDNKEAITWARFEFADIITSDFFPEYIERSSNPPLLLVLGYATGVQVWLVVASGEATEVLSWRQGVVRTLRILPNPKIDDDHPDPYEQKRPLVAICDSSGSGTQFCSISFVSLRTGEQVKSIKFKNPVCDVLANKRSIVVTFTEKIAVFDSRTFDDVLTVTTCYLSPGPNQNPVALGTRWLAYSEKKLLPSRRSSGGSEGEGVQSYTATVLYAAKSLGKGLRGLGETVASSLTGNSVAQINVNNISGDVTQPGVVTILDLQAAKEEKEYDDSTIETVVAHFTAHSDAIVAMTFDLTGAVLMTADRRGHDFHVFRIQPHPGGPTLAAVHHLYVLHRGDTTAKVQDMSFSSDTRWAAVSTVRGTTHVFPVAPYGGPVGMRTHSTSHVVNRLSRFHRSAGLTDDGTRSHSPVSHNEIPMSVYPYSNPRLPPYPHPTILHPLAQIRQPSKLNCTNSQIQPNRSQQRQRLHSDDNGCLPLKICACFAPSRTWIYTQRDSTSKITKRAIDSLFIMACHGNMIQYDLEPKPTTGVPKEKICDDTMIELEVEAKGQWPLLRIPNSLEIIPPLPSSSPLLIYFGQTKYSGSTKDTQQMDIGEDRWLSQVEIVTHAGPHRRLWMGPQFVFKTYNAPSGVNLSESEAVEIGITGGSRPARSNPVNMPHAATRPLGPVVIDGSGSSYEQSPRFMEVYGDSLENDSVGSGHGENQLREDLAEAMLETSTAPNRVTGRRLVVERVGQPVTKVVNPLGTVITVLADEEDASTNQEYDDIDETQPDAPRSLCAEEGPASLSDIEQEGCPLRNLTEICAEMRTAIGPAIDNVPDESIHDVREQKSLCVQAAITNNSLSSTSSSSPSPSSLHRPIDYEKEENFRDIATSLSLCAEQGEIPTSPMTQARENYWNKKPVKRVDGQMQEQNISKAKYVVNYDEDSVVLMENKTTDIKNNIAKNQNQTVSMKVSTKMASEMDSERVTKRPNKQSQLVSRPTKRVTAVIQEPPKYHLHENDDSIIIEVANPPQTILSVKQEIPTKSINDIDVKEKRSSRIKNNIRKVKSIDKTTEAMIVDSKIPCNITEPIELFVDLKTVDYHPDTDLQEPMEATNACGLPSLPPDLPTLDDFNCMDYHIIELNTFGTKDKTTTTTKAYSNKSDDDIEHIFNSDDNSLDVVGEKIVNYDNIIDDYDVSPMRHRKCSKSTISDDDLEHIQTSEISELFERARSLVVERDDFNYQEDFPKQSSDDELEHIVHPEEAEIEKIVIVHSPSSSSSPSPSPSPAVAPTPKNESSTSKSQMSKLFSDNRIGNESMKKQASTPRGSRKRKDVVVIDSEPSNSDITVIVKSLGPINECTKVISPIKDLADDTEQNIEHKEHLQIVDQVNLQSLPKKTKVRTPKSATASTNIQKAMSNCIEIIDIDAMQKAEMEVTNIVTIPECKILEKCSDMSVTRLKKSKRNKKIHGNEGNNLISSTSKQCEQSQITVNKEEKNWDSIVYRPSLTDNLEIHVDEVSHVFKNEAPENEIVPEELKDKKLTKKHVKQSVELKPDDCSSLVAIITENTVQKVCENDSSKNPSVEEITCDELSSKIDDKIDDLNVVTNESKITLDDEKLNIKVDIKSVDDKSALQKTDEDQRIAAERSLSSDHLNINVVPMDTEEDTTVKDIAEKNNATTISPSWSTVAKKNNRSKKKKRR